MSMLHVHVLGIAFNFSTFVTFFLIIVRFNLMNQIHCIFNLDIQSYKLTEQPLMYFIHIDILVSILSWVAYVP